MKQWIIILALMLSVICTSGCSDKEHGAEKGEAWAGDGTGEIFIGVAAPLSFLKAETGYMEGLRLAAEEANSDGGLKGRKIRILEADDESDVTKGVTIAQSFVDGHKVSAVIGHWNSHVTIPAAAIYEHGGVVMLTPSATSSGLIKKEYRYIFRGIPSDARIGGHAAQVMYEKGCRKPVIYYSDNDYGKGQANAFEDAADEKGLSIIDRLTYIGNQQEFTKIKQKWDALDFDSIFIADLMPEAGEFIRQVRKAGIKVPIFGTDGLDIPNFIQACGKDSEGVVITTFYNPYNRRAEALKFHADFKAAYGREPDVWAVQGYEAMNLIIHAIKKAGSASPASISEELHALKDWPGVTGNLSFGEDGEFSGSMIFNKEVINGRFEYISN